LNSFVPIFAAEAAAQVVRWRAAPPGVPVDAAAAMARTTFNVIVEAMLGGPAGLDAGRFGRALTDNFEAIPWHIVYELFGLPAWLPYPGRRRAMRARDRIHSDLGRIVAARRSQASPRPDLLDLLIKARDPETGRAMTDADLVHNLATFITAGHETTAVALTWTLWLLAKDQAAQQRVYDEAMAVAGTSPIEAGQVEELGFTRQVLQEAMRLYPPAAGISRQPMQAMALGGMAITRHTRVHIPIFSLHRNRRLWEHPDAFDPGRFAPEQMKGRSRYAYLPFGGGPRVCIGASFAMIEAAAILVTLIRAFRFHPLPGHKPHPVARVTLRPHGGMPLLVVPR
jgi:cytochrome P450